MDAQSVTPSSEQPLTRAAERLESDIPQLLVELTSITSEEPWLSLPADERLDSIPRVVRDLVHAALTDPAPAQCRGRLIESAIAHGEHRRQQEFAHDVLFTEYYLLREATWRRVRAIVAPELRTEVILRIDHTITVSQRAALLGYHRRELEASGRWASSLNALAAELALP